jgi:hypothetical protein
MPNKEIGNAFEAMSYSAVVKAYGRFSTRLSEDKAQRKKVRQVSAFVHFRGLPYFPGRILRKEVMNQKWAT